MEIETLFGLPAHPLVVHVAVVLLPLAALGTVAVACMPRWRRTYGPVVFVVAALATVAVGLAQGSGEELEEQVDETELVEEHTEQGESVLPWAIGVTLVSGAVAASAYAGDRLAKVSPKALSIGLATAALVVSSGATITVVNVGHSGAKATWDDVQRDGGGGEPGEVHEDDD